ncbi:Tripartite-type tricarboxylate transporter, receptor component TctC [Roseomonas rosea]|uniref:Tripartite-type tricarboxylate transporter, receptor component TctC n=1 Tax=Muricoccus roseus TaxID=198092 RepID=A0A1M6IFS1_9PROT|nr:tripartite tricarboxylate transporter substrate binding protein [Roseomonas rosea]SHJ33300.1 Tripartite-type tricarboxylate transporter, receptor component TctC [Roseomonas rosea]
MRRRATLMLPALTLPALALPALIGPARAQERYPNRPIRLIIPFATGGSNDVVGRLVAEGMGQRLGQTFVVENRGGAGGLIGNDLVAKSRPEGYDLLLAGSGSFLISSLVQPRVPYDVLADFTPVGFIGQAPNVISINPSVPAHTLAELQDVARRARPPLTYGSPGVGTTGHVLPAMIALTLGIEMEHVPYRGTGPALTDVLAGRLSMITNALAPLKPHIESGALRAIAIAAAKRSPVMPNLPTTGEQGFPQILSSTWYGIVGPKDMPAERVARLHAALNATLADPETSRRLLDEGVEVEASETPAAYGRFLSEDRGRWAEVVRRAQIRVE